MTANSQDYLYLIWKDCLTRQNYIVGKLLHQDGFTFTYFGEWQAAAATKRWNFLEAFPEKKEYKSEILFPTFSSRLPDSKRIDISKILAKYGLSNFDAYELLRKSGARLPIDDYEFVDPIFPFEENIQREFYLMGTRHVYECKGNDCNMLSNLSVSSELILLREQGNQFDPNAIKVLDNSRHCVGYIPRYYSEGVSTRLSNNMTYSCTILEINQNQNCNECIKVKLSMPKIDSR